MLNSFPKTLATDNFSWVNHKFRSLQISLGKAYSGSFFEIMICYEKLTKKEIVVVLVYRFIVAFVIRVAHGPCLYS